MPPRSRVSAKLRSTSSARSLNLFGSHSPPLAAYLARVSEPDVSLTRHTRMAHRLFSEYPAPWGGVIYLAIFPSAPGWRAPPIGGGWGKARTGERGGEVGWVG